MFCTSKLSPSKPSSLIEVMWIHQKSIFIVRFTSLPIVWIVWNNIYDFISQTTTTWTNWFSFRIVNIEPSKWYTSNLTTTPIQSYSIHLGWILFQKHFLFIILTLFAGIGWLVVEYQMCDIMQPLWTNHPFRWLQKQPKLSPASFLYFDSFFTDAFFSWWWWKIDLGRKDDAATSKEKNGLKWNEMKCEKRSKSILCI